MAIEKMQLVNIAGLLSDLDKTLLRCCESGCFHMEQAVTGKDSHSSLKMLNEKNPYTATMKKLKALALSCRIKLTKTDYSDISADSPEEFAQLTEGLENRFDALRNERFSCMKEISEKNAVIKQITHLKGLDTDIGRISECDKIVVRMGRLPVDSFKKLEFYDETFFFVPFDSDKDFCWGMYFAPVTEKELVDEIFNSLYFEEYEIPDFVKGTPETAFEELNDAIIRKSRRIEEIDEQLQSLIKDKKDLIVKAYSKLKFRNDTFELRHKVASINEKFYMKGFVPKNNAEEFVKLFDDCESVSVVVKPPDSDSSLVIPTKLKNNRFARPFAMLVEMYGLPDYNGINPTTFVAITYTLLFGIMFGDLGQGFVIFIAGFFLDKFMNKTVGGLFRRVGFSSMVFGFLYGSVFGFEHLLDPVFHAMGFENKPFEVFDQTNFILIGAVAIGVALIAMSMIMNIVQSFRQKDYENAIFGCNGIAGLVFYTSIISAIAFKINYKSPAFIILLIVIPLLCIFCRFPLAHAMKYKKLQLTEDPEEATVGNFIVENFFEMFEYLLSYVSNTMSFLRVGGFVLSHAGMMLVVMTLMESVTAAAQPLVVVLGNAFVMCMEGLIVAIQIIRLEFYEVFSRFYSGNGKPFEPVGVSDSGSDEE